MKNTISFIGFFIVILFVLFVVYIYSVSIGLPNVNALEYWHPPEASIVYDSQGNPIGTIGAQNRIYVSINKIPKIVQDAFVSAEDRTFYHNIQKNLYLKLNALLHVFQLLLTVIYF